MDRLTIYTARQIHTMDPGRPVAKAIADYGRLRLDQGKNDETVPLFKRALRVQEKALGPEHAAECPPNAPRCLPWESSRRERQLSGVLLGAQ